jgi:hypothetical protein
MWLARVSGRFGEMTQQIHSFRANGVRSFQASAISGSEVNAARRSGGIL